MNEEMKKKFLEYVDKLEGAANSVSEFAQQEIPLVLQEYLNWTFYSSLFCGLAWFVMLTLIGLLLMKLAIMGKNESGFESPECAFPLIFSVAFHFIAIVALLTNMYTCVKVAVAPRVVILEQIRFLIN